jgi:hypothetical protein
MDGFLELCLVRKAINFFNFAGGVQNREPCAFSQGRRSTVVVQGRQFAPGLATGNAAFEFSH